MKHKYSTTSQINTMFFFYARSYSIIRRQAHLNNIRIKYLQVVGRTWFSSFVFRFFILKPVL